MLEYLKADWQSLIILMSLLIVKLVLSQLVRWIIIKSFKSAFLKLSINLACYKFFKNTPSFIFWVVVYGKSVSCISKLRSFAITLFTGIGILVARIGFAVQQAFSNIISVVYIIIQLFSFGGVIKVEAFKDLPHNTKR